MALFDPDRLPPALRSLVSEALQDVEACEAAIDALEAALGQRDAPVEVGIALALLLHHEAAELVLSQLEPASMRALALLDQAEARGAAPHRLAPLRALCERSIEAERRRERRWHAGWSDEDALTLRAHRTWLRGSKRVA